MKWKLVPENVVTGEMVAAGIATPVANTGNDDVDRPEDYKQVFLSMLEAAPMPPALTDERIFKLFLEKAVDKGTAGIYDFARAIEREILGCTECTS